MRVVASWQRSLNLLGSQCVENVNADFLKADIQSNEYDLIIGVDIVFQLIIPLYDLAEKDLLEKIFSSLKRGGKLLMEIVDYSQRINEIEERGGVIREWVEFPLGDPYQYSLNMYTTDEDKNLVVDKTFIDRTSSNRTYMCNVIRPYTRDSITDVLSNNGFSVEIYDNECEYDLKYENIEKSFRVIATKK